MKRLTTDPPAFAYSASALPRAQIAPGERILLETKYAFGDQPLKPGDTLADIDLDLCDPLTGPLFVQGAEPGDSIAVHIDHVESVGTAAQGVIPGIGLLEWPTLPAAFPDAALHADLNWPTPYLVAAAAAPPMRLRQPALSPINGRSPKSTRPSPSSSARKPSGGSRWRSG